MAEVTKLPENSPVEILPKKAKDKPVNIPEAGNTAELLKLKEEITRLEYSKKNLVKEIDSLKQSEADYRKKYFDTKTALDNANKKIIELETANNKSSDAKSEYVEIVAVPPVKGIKPLPVKLNGIPVPKKVDEDGFHVFTVPKANALALMSAGTGMKFYLLGPVDSVSGIVPNGLYTKKVTYQKHTKRKSPSGDVTWIPVEVV